MDADCATGHSCISEGAEIPYCRWSWGTYTQDTITNIELPEGKQLGIFAVGGGGGASAANSGSSGYFKYQVLGPFTGPVTAHIWIGGGGSSSSDGGRTKVRIDGEDGSKTTIKANGGGGDARPGWSGGANSWAGENGGQGDYLGNGSGEQLPALCNRLSKLQYGRRGYSYYDDGTGAGGIYVNGYAPSRCCTEDGYGYGAGGGEDDHHGYPGIALIMVCE